VFDPPFSAERIYVVDKDLVSGTVLKASVMVVDLESSTSTRRDDEETHTIGIALHKKVANAEPATIDPLVNVMRAVRDFFRSKELAGATVMKRRSRPLYDHDALRKRRQFIGFVELDCELIYAPE